MIFKRRVSRIEQAKERGGGQFGQTNFELYVDCYRESDLTVIKKKGGGCLELTHEEANELADYLIGANEWLETDKRKSVIAFGSLGEGAQIFDEHLSIFLKPEMIHIGENARIDGAVKCEGGMGIHIGKGTHISSRAHLNVGGGKLEIGDYVAITTGACIITGTNTMDGQSMSSAAPPEMQVIERGEFSIGSFAFIGAHAVVDRANVGRYAVIGACSLIKRDVPDYAIVWGRPGVIVGDRRDREGWDFA